MLEISEDQDLIDDFRSNLTEIKNQFRKAYPDRETRPPEIQEILNLRPWTVDIEAVKKIHFERGSIQKVLQGSISDEDLIKKLIDTNDETEDPEYVLVEQSKSVAHQFENGVGGTLNRKYVSEPDGRQEVVLRKTGPGKYDWEILDETNGAKDAGSYNFSGGFGLKHMELDVVPWIKFGNSDNDMSTALERAKQFCPDDKPKPDQPDPDASDPAKDAMDKIEDGEKNSSPLVFDLDGDGIEVVSLADSTVFWDIDLDGFKERSGWVAADDGLLAIDLNGDGQINNHAELFGTDSTDGFSILAGYDSNSDGLITTGDAQFADLLIWQDLNQDGLTDDGELSSLSDLGITEIALAATQVNQQNQGHSVSHISTYTVNIEGVTTTRDVHDVWFNYDNFVTVFTPDYAFDPTVFFMPNLRGYGELPDLSFALMSESPVSDTLRPLVTDLTDKSLTELMSQPYWVQDQMRAIMFAWAGVDQIDPTSRGPNIDARELHFLETFSAEPFLQRGWSPDPFYFAGQDLAEAFQILLDATTGRLLAQTVAAFVFEDPPQYDSYTDSVTIGGTTLDDTALAQVIEIAGNSNDPLSIWSGLVRLIEFGAGTDALTAQSYSALDAAIQASVSELTLTEVVASLGWASDAGTTEFGTNENDRITGTVGDDDLSGSYGNDIIKGGVGADTISGDAGNDLLIGGVGADLIFGSFGKDTYLYQLGHGVDTYDEEGNEFDRIKLGAGIEIDHVTIERVSNGDMRILIDTGSQTGQILVQDQFNYAAGQGAIEQLLFADGQTIRLDNLSHTLRGSDLDDWFYGVGRGGKTNDKIYGGGGNDTIYASAPNFYDLTSNHLFGQQGDDVLVGSRGDDYIYGGQGNDSLRGDSGNDLLVGGTGDDDLRDFAGDDTYKFNYGHGNDRIDDENGTADVLAFGAGITADDISFYRLLNSTLVLLVDGGAGGSIKISSQFEYLGGIETFQFADGSTLDLTDTQFTTYGTDAGEQISGIRYGGSVIDTIYAGKGDDTVYVQAPNFSEYTENTAYGQAGDDAIYGGRGDDALYGGSGNDSLRGDSGNDLYVGGKGNDYIYDFAGDDTYKFSYGHGNDIISESNGAADVLLFGNGITVSDISFYRLLNSTLVLQVDGGAGGSIQIDSQFDYRGGIETFQFADGSTLDLTETQFTTYGTDAGEQISGIRYGGSVIDTIYAGKGDDTVYVQAPNAFEYTENTAYGQAGDDTITGGRGDDALYGNSGNDTLSGAGGNDLIHGGGGDDTMYGGTGVDTFVYTSGQDTIFDFAGDVLQLKDTLWDGADLTATQILDFASVIDGDTVFDFGDGNTLRLIGITDPATLETAIEWF
ncbi:calcium-binding protein [Algirhabdus cladophorae]|uniref:calcium-binding protein n=1 Tax=Algirhabdus cladophorae TaxID=3377108 RepID=UPI003B84863E